MPIKTRRHCCAVSFPSLPLTSPSHTADLPRTHPSTPTMPTAMITVERDLLLTDLNYRVNFDRDFLGFTKVCACPDLRRGRTWLIVEVLPRRTTRKH